MLYLIQTKNLWFALWEDFFFFKLKKFKFFCGFLFDFFTWTSELCISQAFSQHQAFQIPTPYEHVVSFVQNGL
jgi:hypothetical protein